MAGISPSDFDYVRRVVREASSIVLEDGKEYLAESRLDALARREGIGSVAELVGRLRGGRAGGLAGKVVEAMATHETSFFRDARPFVMIRDALLPDLIARRAATRRLALWSAACSTGQEAYTLAMIVRENFPELDAWDVRILATDLSGDAIETAARGRYSQMEVGRGLPAGLLLKYFHRDGLIWEANAELRAAVEFRPMNLAGPWAGPGPVDLVLMRNVLIYFDDESRRAVLAKVRDVLRPDGYLILGGTESPRPADRLFERLSHGQGIAYRPVGHAPSSAALAPAALAAAGLAPPRPPEFTHEPDR